MRSSDFPWRVAADCGAALELLSDCGDCKTIASPGDLHESPAVGDWIALDGDRIGRIAPRRGTIARARANGGKQIVAANVTAGFIVTSPEEREFSPRRVARYVLALRAGGVEPVIVLNKCDVPGALERCVPALREVADGAAVIPISARDGTNCDALELYLQPGMTAALCGSSGVGKSTLLNRFAGGEFMATTSMRVDGRGRHTTSIRRLLVLANGAAIVDTPGMRAFTPWAPASDVDEAFGDVASAAKKCRFADCRHDAEPGCAVRDGVSVERLEQWHKLRRELEWVETLHDVNAAQARKAKWKQIHKAARAKMQGRQ